MGLMEIRLMKIIKLFLSSYKKKYSPVRKTFYKYKIPVSQNSTSTDFPSIFAVCLKIFTANVEYRAPALKRERIILYEFKNLSEFLLGIDKKTFQQFRFSNSTITKNDNF